MEAQPKLAIANRAAVRRGIQLLSLYQMVITTNSPVLTQLFTHGRNGNETLHRWHQRIRL